MKRLREILDFIPLVLLIVGGIAFSIYFQEWILLGLIILGTVLSAGFIYLLGMGLESGFRNRFPLDFLMHLTTEVDFFKEKGYQIINYEDPGSEHPGVVMQKENSPHIKIILDAPIMSFNYNVNACIMENPEMCIHYTVATDHKTKIEMLNELYNKI